MSDTTKAKRIHGAPVERDVPCDMQATSPVPCDFKVGDRVIFTNDYGVQFEQRVRGFANPPHGARFVYTHTDCWWFPTDPKQLRHVSQVVALPA